MNKKKLIFLGTNSVLERHIEACELQGQSVAGIIDSDWFGNRDTFAGVPMLDSQDIFATVPEKYKDYVFFVAVNWNPRADRDINKRKMFIDLVRKHNLPCINLIDPRSYVSKFATLGQNIFIGPGVNIEPYATVEDFATIWSNTTLGHHNRVGENSVLQREAVVHAQIGKDVYVGIATTIVGNDHYMTIGDGANIGPCLHVARNVAPGEKISLSRDEIRIFRRSGLTT